MKVSYRKEYGGTGEKELSTYVFENLHSDGDGGELENMKDEIRKLRSFISMIMDRMCEKDSVLIDQIGIHFLNFDLKHIDEREIMNDKGYTLVELLLAIVMIAFGFVAVLVFAVVVKACTEYLF